MFFKSKWLPLLIIDKKLWTQFVETITFSFKFGNHFKISIVSFITIVITFLLTKKILRLSTRVISDRLTEENKLKFKSLFSFFKYFIYLIVGGTVCNQLGINITPILAASTALLVGVGLALQTFFQDIISGVFILVDQTIKVGDIIQFNGKMVRVEEIKLRTTRAVTITDKIIIIPNHHYLTNSLYNWTQNRKSIRDYIRVNIAYGTDIELVRKVLLEAVRKNPHVMKLPEPTVFFDNFGENALEFRVIYTISTVFSCTQIRSDIRFEIYKLFKKNGIKIPLPQREVRVVETKNPQK